MKPEKMRKRGLRRAGQLPRAPRNQLRIARLPMLPRNTLQPLVPLGYELDEPEQEQPKPASRGRSMYEGDDARV